MSSTAPATTNRVQPQPLGLHRTRAIIVGGLVVGAVLGFGGNFVEKGDTQSILYGLSAVGLIMSTVLLAVEHIAAGNRLAAAGFALLALGETRVLNPTTLVDGEASFAAGVFLYAPGLLLVALSAWGPTWTRITSALAALPFALHALLLFAGREIDSTDPLAGTGYGLLTLTIIGWIVHLLRSEGSRVGG